MTSSASGGAILRTRLKGSDNPEHVQASVTRASAKNTNAMIRSGVRLNSCFPVCSFVERNLLSILPSDRRLFIECGIAAAKVCVQEMGLSIGADVIPHEEVGKGSGGLRL